MLTAVAAMGVFSEDDKGDAIKEMVLVFLASYVGIAVGVSLLVELIKMFAKDWAKPKAPHICIILTFVLGPAAKILMPEAYGPAGFKGWTLHAVILLFVAALAAVFHDKLWNAVKGKIGSIIPGGAEGRRG